MTAQLAEWAGPFGRDYTDRNNVDPNTRIDGLRSVLDGLPVRWILEVGCNRGHNLAALQTLGYDDAVGVEPSLYARRLAQAAGLAVDYGTADTIPYYDTAFDLVFTSGVLIHVPPDHLNAALRELIRVSRRYLLAIEYAADEDTEVPYRGLDDMLWKRDYGHHYTQAGVTQIATGAGPKGFDGATWWLFEKPSEAGRSVRTL